ncbi:MAG: methyltransferase domain-containing protein [Paludibacter sp.]|jgi:ubiquinone/menaquinone biosynthesis C-methylase UbiE|nr:methyltransferase domain-containing protein [Paludibacter sp.]
MEKKEVAAFFDRLAPVWDEDNKYDEQKIEKILDYAGIRQGVSVLDIACGTDILFPFYLRRGVSKIAGVDLSEGMIALAKQKFSDPRIELICADACELVLNAKYDCCMVYSAFPHFDHPAGAITAFPKFLAAGGRLTVAHSESKQSIDLRHSCHATNVSIQLLIVISDSDMYVVSGILK